MLPRVFVGQNGSAFGMQPFVPVRVVEVPVRVDEMPDPI